VVLLHRMILVLPDIASRSANESADIDTW